MKLTIQSILAAALMATFATGAIAKDAARKDDGDVTYSYYIISCGGYVEHRQKGTPSDNLNTADTFYIAGWISAYNRMEPDAGIPEDTTLDDVKLWLEQYCRENPLSDIEKGLFQLGQEVKPRHAQESPQEITPEPEEVPEPEQHSLPPRHVPLPGLKPLSE